MFTFQIRLIVWSHIFPLCCALQVWTPSYSPSTLTTATWMAAWPAGGHPRCPTSSRSPRRALAACGRSPRRAWAACWGRSAPPRPWCPASPPEWAGPRTRCPSCHEAPPLVTLSATVTVQLLSGKIQDLLWLQPGMLEVGGGCSTPYWRGAVATKERFHSYFSKL